MRIQRATPVNELLAKILFLLFPTILIAFFIIWSANQYYTILNNQALRQCVYMGVGMVGSALFYSFRFRFIPSFLILSLFLYLSYKAIDATAVGEFDTFFLSIQFRVFSILLVMGWIIGWGFLRLRFFSIFISALFLCICILLLAKQNSIFDISTSSSAIIQFASVFGPIALYSVYIIFTAELIRNYKDKSQKFWWFMGKRLFLFGILSVFLLGTVMYFMKNEITDTMASIGSGGEEGKNSMLKKNKDNTFDLEQYTRLRGSLGRSNEPLFAAYIDNFFPDSDVPNPLYLTAFYYAQFDTLTETFERDSLMPDKDLFEPDPSQIPLFFTKSDSSVLQYALTEKLRRTVEIEVYKQQLSPTSFAAPSTSFFIQPITIEKEYQQEFKSAYRAKSLISELNSAYFVYNADDPQIKAFQEQRFDILRNIKNYEAVDKQLMEYYTFIPGKRFDNIKTLSEQITRGKLTPIDKVIAVRDYFLSKDEFGEPLFSYTDNPGIPDIPSASKLEYFLFENRKGYCAYYAGATLFMLRSLGIPARITVGFLTVDRSSNKNRGWYWYYADQAHAWVQVYFPGYGWLDFDTTVGNDDARESPQADGTPPMQPPKAYLAADGIIRSIDTSKKLISFDMSRMVYHDEEYDLPNVVQVDLDMSIAEIKRDSIDIPLSLLQVGDSAMAISYAEVYRKMKPAKNENVTGILRKMPSPAPIDELHIKKQFERQAEKEKIEEQVKESNWKRTLAVATLVLLSLLLLFALLPRIIYSWYKIRYSIAKSTSQKSFWAYKTAGFYTHQLGYYKGTNTPLQHAHIIDDIFHTKYVSFIIPYLKLKYSNQSLTQEEKSRLVTFLPVFLKQIKQNISFKKRFIDFFIITRTISYYSSPDVNENDL